MWGPGCSHAPPMVVPRVAVVGSARRAGVRAWTAAAARDGSRREPRNTRRSGGDRWRWIPIQSSRGNAAPPTMDLQPCREAHGGAACGRPGVARSVKQFCAGARPEQLLDRCSEVRAPSFLPEACRPERAGAVAIRGSEARGGWRTLRILRSVARLAGPRALRWPASMDLLPAGSGIAARGGSLLSRGSCTSARLRRGRRRVSNRSGLRARRLTCPGASTPLVVLPRRAG